MQQLSALLAEQDGVISRRQARSCGVTDNDLRRMVRRRDLVAVHPGVYANHSGSLTWHQRAWAAVLSAWPAALSHESALRAADGPGRRNCDDADPVHVAIGPHRTLLQPDGVVMHQLSGLSSRTHWNRSPPRVRVEEAALDVAAEAQHEFDAVAVLAGVVSSRQTTATRLLYALRRRKRIARRTFLSGVLADVVKGTCSVLEHGYLTRVERAHGLPIGARQAIDVRRGTLYRDVLYTEFNQIVELDGRIFHSGAHNRDRDRDLERDLDAATDGVSSVRLGWSQVFDTPCRTATKIATVLQRQGWTGETSRCTGCGVSEQERDLQSPGDCAARSSWSTSA